MVAYICNDSSWKAVAEGSRVQGSMKNRVSSMLAWANQQETAVKNKSKAYEIRSHGFP